MIFKRPWPVLPLFVLALIFTVRAWARAWTGLQIWGFLAGLGISVSPVYLVITGVVWGIFGLVAVFMVWWGKSAAPWVVTLGAVAFSINFWIEQLFMMTSPLRKVNWPFLIVFDLILVLFAALTFKQSGVGEFYGGRHEQEIQQ